MALEQGTKAPAFKGSTDGGRTASLASLKGSWVVLYFYPKDSTPGCTQEGMDFRDLYPGFQAANAEVLGKPVGDSVDAFMQVAIPQSPVIAEVDSGRVQKFRPRAGANPAFMVGKPVYAAWK